MIEVSQRKPYIMASRGVIPIRAWSNSRLGVFEQCHLRTKLQVVDGIPEPQRPLPPGKSEHAHDRGSRIHAAAEMYVRGGVELIEELRWFKPELDAARALFAEGRASLEGEWAYDAEWSPVAWMSSDCWCRIKCDLVVFPDPTSAIVVDYKSGKRYRNEAKHAEQGRLYAMGAFLRYPQLEALAVELWYTDLDELHDMVFTREEAMAFLPGFQRRGLALTTELEFAPNPNSFSCKWCPYKPAIYGGTGHCSVGVP